MEAAYYGGLHSGGPSGVVPLLVLADELPNRRDDADG